MPYASVGAILDTGWVEHPTHEAGPMPVLLADGARGDRAGEPSCERDGGHKQPSSAAAAGRQGGRWFGGGVMLIAHGALLQSVRGLCPRPDVEKPCFRRVS